MALGLNNFDEDKSITRPIGGMLPCNEFAPIKSILSRAI
jgi:hypothetical protein